jgi:N-acetylated-alpha-linked acidic dipeptidase
MIPGRRFDSYPVKINKANFYIPELCASKIMYITRQCTILQNVIAVYHSVYDSLCWYEKFADPHFVSGPTMATLNGVLALRFANADVIPYSVGQYATDFKGHVENLSQRAQILQFGFDQTVFDHHIHSLSKISVQYEKLRDSRLDEADVLDNVNHKLIGLERAWVHSDGLQNRLWSRSLFGAEDPFEGYAPWMLPGLRWEVEQKNESGLQIWTEIYVQALVRLEHQVHDIVDLLV